MASIFFLAFPLNRSGRILLARSLSLVLVGGVTAEYPVSIVLDLTAHLFLKNDECARINYRQLRGILYLSLVGQSRSLKY